MVTEICAVQGAESIKSGENLCKRVLIFAKSAGFIKLIYFLFAKYFYYDIMIKVLRITPKLKTLNMKRRIFSWHM